MVKNIIIVLSVFALISSCAKKEEEKDTSAPYDATISINGGENTSSLTVSIALTAKDDVGVVAYWLSPSSSGSSGTGWVEVTSAVSYSGTVSYTLTTATTRGDYEYVYAWFKDAAGNVSSSYVAAYVYYYPVPPTSPSITINGGAASTDNSSVTLSLSALDNVGVVGYLISTTSTTPIATASGWEDVTSTDNYTDNVSYVLTGAAGTLNTVNAWFKDGDGSISDVDNDSIMYCSSGTTTMDEVEPNNSTATAMDLCPTSLITGGNDGYSTESSYYADDYFKVTASSNTMTVSFSHVSALASASDYDVYVYNSSGTQIDSFDADNGVDNEIELWVTSGESYYIRARGSYGTTYQYKLNVQFSTTSGSLELDTANDTIATAMTLTDNTTMRGERNGSSDYSDYYKITVPSGKTSMNVAFSHDNASASGSDNIITIYKYIAEGNTPTVQYFTSNDGVDDNKTFGVEADVIYFILVDVNSSLGDYSNGYTRYRYGLRVSFGTEVYELEQNNSTATAHSITAGTTYTGGNDGYAAESSYYADDYFKVTASSNTMTVSFSHVSALASASDYDVYVYNSSGTQIDSFDADNGVDNEIELWVTSGVDYYIRARGSYGTTYKYTLNVQFSTTSGSLELDTANDTIATAMTLTDNTTMRGERNGSWDYSDYYKITVPSGKTSMNVAFSHDNASASGSDNIITIHKYIAEGNTPTVQYFTSNDGVDDNKTFGVVAGSDYYFLVDVNSSLGDYSNGYTRYRYGLRVSFGTEVYELEQNNTTATAHSITAGTTYTGGNDGYSAESSYYANDYFAVTASSTTMTVSFTHVTALDSASDYTVYVYNSSGTQVDSFDANNGVDTSDNTSVTSGASYFIRARGSYGTTYKYTLTVSF